MVYISHPKEIAALIEEAAQHLAKARQIDRIQQPRSLAPGNNAACPSQPWRLRGGRSLPGAMPAEQYHQKCGRHFSGCTGGITLREVAVPRPKEDHGKTRIA